jgi:hypothetical protein
VVFVVLEITNYIIHMGILGSSYQAEELQRIMRPEEQMQSMMWIMWVVDLLWSFFFTFFFVKGYENRGLMEGVRFGIYMGLFVSLVYAYGAYAVYPIPYSLALQWFMYGFIQMIILGLIAAVIYKPKVSAETVKP